MNHVIYFSGSEKTYPYVAGRCVTGAKHDNQLATEEVCGLPLFNGNNAVINSEGYTKCIFNYCNSNPESFRQTCDDVEPMNVFLKKCQEYRKGDAKFSLVYTSIKDVDQTLCGI